MTDAPTRWQIFTGANPTVERIIPELAVEIGLNESIMLMQISFWINGSNNIREGVYWTYHSIREMHKNYFPYWSIATIHRTIVNLKDQGYILTGEFNKRKNDHTQWFALEPDKLSTLKSVLIAPALPIFEGKPFQNETPPFQNETTLPKNTTNIKKDSPTGVGDSDPKSPKPKTERAANPMYDAIKAVWGYTAARNGQMANLLTGKATKKGYAEYNLDQPVTPDELLQWAAWYRKTALGGDEKMSMVEELIKVQSSITRWQELTADGGTGEDEVKYFSDTEEFIGGKPW